jgi:electron transfer flavoprotein alpha subunit
LDECPLVFVELAGGRPTPGSLGVLGRAREVFGRAAAVVGGHDAAAIGAGLGSSGAEVVYASEAPVLQGDDATAHVDAIVALTALHGFRTVLFENSNLTADIAGALSARLEAGVNWSLTDLAVSGTRLTAVGPSAPRAGLAGDALAEVGWVSDHRLAVFAADVFAPRQFSGAASVIPFAPTPRGKPARDRHGLRVVSGSDAETEPGTLQTAELIVAGGRGMRDPSALGMLEELAQLLGGVVGVSMPIVDRGWYPYRHQVGSATPSVRPGIYIACGISGSLQHRIGMQHSRFVVAINTDRDAPIMSIADVGVVGDLHEIIPRLIELARGAGRPVAEKSRPNGVNR